LRCLRQLQLSSAWCWGTRRPAGPGPLGTAAGQELVASTGPSGAIPPSHSLEPCFGRGRESPVEEGMKAPPQRLGKYALVSELFGEKKNTYICEY